MNHFNLINQTLITANKIPGVRLWSNPVGIAYNGRPVKQFKNKNRINIGGLDPEKSYMLLEYPRPVKYGLIPGSSDTIGFIERIISGKKIAQFIAPEMKIKYDKLSEKQKNFMNMVNGSGGLSFEVRPETDVYDVLTNTVI